MLPILILFWLCILGAAQNVCLPRGVCERCPEEAMHQPFCQPFGNRRLMHCTDSTATNDTTTNDSDQKRPPYAQRSPSSNQTSSGSESETIILAWESCGRVVSQERADFFEFIGVNMLFVVGSVLVVIWRSMRMRDLHARQLAARIGLARRRG